MTEIKVDKKIEDRKEMFAIKESCSIFLSLAKLNYVKTGIRGALIPLNFFLLDREEADK
jgi:hypothetical protein